MKLLKEIGERKKQILEYFECEELYYVEELYEDNTQYAWANNGSELIYADDGQDINEDTGNYWRIEGVNQYYHKEDFTMVVGYSNHNNFVVILDSTKEVKID